MSHCTPKLSGMYDTFGAFTVVGFFVRFLFFVFVFAVTTMAHYHGAQSLNRK